MNELLISDFEFYAPWFTARGVGLINASPVGMGILGPDSGVPAWHPAAPNACEVISKAKAYAKAKGFDLGKSNWTF